VLSPDRSRIDSDQAHRAHLDSGADVRFCDLQKSEGPTERFILQQMASDRTKKALKVAKALGRKLGGNRGSIITRRRAPGR
jgi:hypothetical protein